MLAVHFRIAAAFAASALLGASPTARAAAGAAKGSADAQPPAKSAAGAGHAKSAGEPASGPAAVKAGRRLALRVQRFYGRAKDFSASFAQRYSYPALDRVDEKTGVVQVKKPGLVRWEYQTPEKRLLLLDGAAFWQWVPEDNQVTVKRSLSGNELSSAFTFLWGKGDLLAEFSPRAIPRPEGLPEGDALELSPRKPGGSVQKLVFAVGAKGQVLASVVTDAQGNENRLIFTDAKVDQKLPAASFVFEVPKGASVQELP